MLSSRPARAAPSPPLRPSVQTVCSRPRLARIRPEAPRTRPIGIDPYAAVISVTGPLYQESTIPAGTASTASAPTTADATARGLLLLVGLAIRGGRRRAPDHTADRDERQHVGQRLEER